MATNTLDPAADPDARPVAVPGPRHHVGFWLTAFAFGVAMAFSTVPTPLYPSYRAADGFSTFTVTVVFAVYAVGVGVGLVLAGHVSDWVGRRSVLLPALVLELVAAGLFLASSALPVLLVARTVNGLAVGALSATATAWLADLDRAHRPGASPLRFQAVSTAANLGGLGVGTLVTGVLADRTDAPLRLPYAVFVVLLLAAVAAAALTPETVRRPAVRPAWRPQRVGAGHPGRRTAWPSAFSAFAVFGLFTAMAPTFLAATVERPSRTLVGAVVFVVFAASAAGQLLTRTLPTRVRGVAGAVAEVAGVAALAAAAVLGSLPLFVVGGLAAGAGAGVLFSAAVATVTAAAPPRGRGEALAGLFLVAYLGLAVPVLGIGVVTLLT